MSLACWRKQPSAPVLTAPPATPVEHRACLCGRGGRAGGRVVGSGAARPCALRPEGGTGRFDRCGRQLPLAVRLCWRQPGDGGGLSTGGRLRPQQARRVDLGGRPSAPVGASRLPRPSSRALPSPAEPDAPRTCADGPACRACGACMRRVLLGARSCGGDPRSVRLGGAGSLWVSFRLD